MPMKKLAFILGFGGIIVAFGPLLLALLSFPLSYLFGCTDGGANPGVCSIGGSAMGEVMWMLAMLHWFTLVTILPGLGLSLLGIILGIISWIKGRQSKTTQD